MSDSGQPRFSVVTEPNEFLNPNARKTTMPYAPSLYGSAGSTSLSSPALMPCLDRHVSFHPIVRQMPTFGSAEDDLFDSESMPPTSSPPHSRKGRLRIAKTTLSVPLSFSTDWLFFDAPVLSPTSNDSQHAAYARRRREFEDETFTPSPPLKLKISLPSLTRRPSRRELRLQDAERVRRWREATGGKLKSCLKAPPASPCHVPSASGIGVDNTNVGIAFSANFKICPMPPSTHSRPFCDASVATYHPRGDQVAINVPVLEDASSQFAPPTVIVTANGTHCLPAFQLRHERTQKKTFEESGKAHSGPFNRLTKRTSGSSCLHLPFFTPKPSRLGPSSNISAERVGVIEREVLEDPKADLEPLIPVSPWASNLIFSRARHESDAGRSLKNSTSSSLGTKSTSDSKDCTRDDGPVTLMSECLDLIKRAEDSTKAPLPTRSHFYHQVRGAASRASKVSFFGTDSSGTTAKTSTKSKSDEHLKKYKYNLRPCCKNCLEATLKGSDPDHEILFSPQALQIYRAHASGNDKFDVSEEDSVKTEGFAAEQSLNDTTVFSPELTRGMPQSSAV